MKIEKSLLALIGMGLVSAGAIISLNRSDTAEKKLEYTYRTEVQKPSALPEPSTAYLLATGAAAGAAYCLYRRYRGK